MSTEPVPGRRKDGAIQDLEAENRRLRQRISQLSDVSRRITSSLDLAVVLQEVVDAACALTGARYGALAAFDDSGRIQRFATHGITPQEQARVGDPPQGLGLLGWLQHLQQPLRLADLSRHPRSVGFPPNHPPMATFLGAPIRHGDEPLGNLYLTEKASGAEFTAEDERLVVLFAAQAAAAIHNAHLFHTLEESEKALRQSQAATETERQRLLAMVETAPVGVILAEAPDGRIVLVNREAERILGLPNSSQEALAQYEQALVCRRPDGRAYERADLPMQRALHRGETVRAEEVWFELPDGRTAPTLVNATPIYSEGRITGAITVIQDIAPLQEVEQLRNEFLGIVSHELKTPLTAIKGSAAIALGSKRSFDAQETRELFEIIDEQADRLRDLVDNLLDMSRIEAGTLAMSPEPLELRGLVEEVRSSFTRGMDTHEIRTELPDELPPVHADRRRLTQVLMNLLSNAVKFSPASSPITIGVEANADQATVHVQDQGRGIAREKLPHLFKKFSQVHQDAGRGLVGTGLGLAICKGIVEAHGGRIWADSPGEGRGTTFSFTLPLAVAVPETEPLDTSQRATHVGSVHRRGERTRILAVDDDPQTLRYLRRSLEEAGYQTIVTGDPSVVLDLVASEEPDLVLLDVMLPGTTGFDLLQRLRAVSGVPVIFLTARNQDDDMVRALRMGADDYVSKPFSPPELLARIEVALRRRVLPDQMEARPPFVLEDLTMDFAARHVTVGGESVSLSATEYKLLYELATNAGRVLTHDQILHRVWGPEYGGETDLVRSFIRNLRRKLGDDARHPRFIFTEPQVGYRMPRSTAA